MEAKLREYRALRRRKELLNSAKETLERTKEKVVDFLVPRIFKDMGMRKQEDHVLLLENEEIQPKKVPITSLIMDDPIDAASDTSEAGSFVIGKEESWKYFTVKWSIYIIIWLTLYGIFLKLQFGAVFFVVSALLAIYFNTRTRPKRKGEISAYSVFNENCVSIDGTLKAEQFEKEIRYGAGTVRSY